MTCRPGTSSISSPERWIKAGVFESLAHDLRAVLRIAEGRKESPTTAIIDSHTLQSTPESGGRAGYDVAKRRKSSKDYLAVDTLRHLLALCVTAADELDRAQISLRGLPYSDVKERSRDTFLKLITGSTGLADRDWTRQEFRRARVAGLPALFRSPK